MAGRVVQLEIPFNDGDRARGFYKEIFDWQLQTMPEMGGYTLVMSGPSGDQGPTEPGFINGGMLARQESATPDPVIVVDVDDIDATLEKIGGLGGSTLTPKVLVGDMGFAAYFTDPEGKRRRPLGDRAPQLTGRARPWPARRDRRPQAAV